MSKHTPGPWGTDLSEHDSPYQDIVVRSGTRTICRVWIDDAPVHDYNAEQIANAHLIAAAPELLEALRMWLQLHETPAGYEGKYGKALDAVIAAQQVKVDAAANAARAAIAKVEGRS